MNYHKIE